MGRGSAARLRAAIAGTARICGAGAGRSRRERRCWAELGYTSLFWFLHRELGLSKGAAFFRKTAAELVRSFPEVIEPLRDGRLCLTSVVALSKVITPENRAAVLPRFFHRSKAEAMEVVAELKPVDAPRLREVVTAVTAASPAVAVRPEPVEGRAVLPALAAFPGALDFAIGEGFPENPVDASSPGADAHAPTFRDHRERVEPLTAELRRLHLTVSRRLLDKLAAARDALSHSMPDASTDELIEAGLDLLLEKAARAKGIVEKPQRNPRPSRNGDHIPAHVKREVMKRDGGRCQWRLPNGEICGCTRHLQFDHLVPRALGGLSTVDNVRLLCRSHNLEAARRVLGEAVMDRYTRRGGKRARVARDVDDGDTANATTPAASPP